jgi:hypothetical protein
MLHVDLHIVRDHKVVPEKNDFMCSLCKRTRNKAKISLFMLYLSFFEQHTKNSFFHEIVLVHIEYEYIYANIFVLNF